MTQVDVRQRILADNAAAAATLRERFTIARTLVVNLISSPGSGKTTLLEATVRAFGGRLRLGAIEGGATDASALDDGVGTLGAARKRSTKAIVRVGMGISLWVTWGLPGQAPPVFRL